VQLASHRNRACLLCCSWPAPNLSGVSLAPDGGFFQSGVRDRNTINGSEMNKPIDNAGEAILAVELVLVRYKPSLK
jgi:hypothetical protein